MLDKLMLWFGYAPEWQLRKANNDYQDLYGEYLQVLERATNAEYKLSKVAQELEPAYEIMQIACRELGIISASSTTFR